MAEWLYEQGIGENRAILVEDDEILEAAIERPAAQRAGAVLPARLTHILVAGRRGIASIEGGEEALVEPLQAGLCEGARFRVEIVREPIDEAGHRKLALARACEAAPRPGPDLAERTGPHVQLRPDEPDRFEQAGWSELLEQAASGTIPFAGGTLRMSLTPAMTLFDVDGPLDPELLAIAGAEAAARTIRRFGLGGSIGIDLPTLPRGPARKAAAATFDAILPAPFERSAVNGFGFLQVILRRERASIPEIVQADPIGAAARALLRRAERSSGTGPLAIEAATAVIARLEANPDWLEELGRRAGGQIALQAREGAAISAGHVQRQNR